MTIDFAEILPQLTPDVQIETDWSGAFNALPRDVKKLLLLGYKTSAGSATVGVAHRITGLAQSILLFGKGSQIACMVERALQVSTRIPLYAMAYTESAGIAATANIAFTGTSATASGEYRVTIGGRFVRIGIAVGDTPTIIGLALETAINALANAPFTGTNTTGTVAVLARNNGLSGNTIGMVGTLIGATGITVVTAATLASGTLEGDPATPLAGIEGQRYHLIALNTSDSATAIKLRTHCEKQSGVTVKKWCLGIVPWVTTEALGSTEATAIASYRMQLVWHKACPQPEFELVAAFGALRATKPANRSLDYLPLLGIDAQPVQTNWPTAGDIEAALGDGVTPLIPQDDGTVQVVRSVVTKTSAAAFIDSMTIEISDYVDGYIIVLFTARVMGKPLKSGSAPGMPGTITPARANVLLNEALGKLDRADYLQGVADAYAAGLTFTEVNASDANRLDGAMKFWPIAFAHFIALKKSYSTEA